MSKPLLTTKSPIEGEMNHKTVKDMAAFTRTFKSENINKFPKDTIKKLKRHKQIHEQSHQIILRQTITNKLTCPTDISSIYSTDSSSRGNLNRLKKQMFSGLANHNLRLMLWSLVILVLLQHVASNDMPRATKETTSSSAIRYSQLLSTNGQMTTDNKDTTTSNNEDAFRPFIPNDPEMISRNVFTPSGQFQVFQPIDTDLRAAVALQSKSLYNGNTELKEPFNRTSSSISLTFNTNATTNAKVSTSKYQIIRDHKTTEANVLPIVNQPAVTSNLVQIEQLQLQQQQQQHQFNTIKKSNEHSHRSMDIIDVRNNEITKQDVLLDADTDLATDFKNLEDLLVDYVTDFFEKGQYEPMPGLLVELQNQNHSAAAENSETLAKTRTVRQTKGVTDAKVHIDLPRTLATGRLLFLTGLKKVLWPVFMGLQVLKSLLIAMFIPAIIGSFAKLLGKGISTGSAPLFIRPMDPPQELDFRDNSINFDDDKFLATEEGLKNNGPYAYNQPDASQMHNDYVFDPATTNNQLSFTRLGMNERQHQLMQDSYMSALQSIGSASFKNSGSLSSSSSGLLAPMAKKPPAAANVNTFQQFQKVPDSSLLLSNYDPFYSPLLSRLDSVFAQLKINSDKEICREKVICLMYANPAKYAPYSNLVSAQLSRELNELRKPTSDNPDILRFFKYMRAAKDGQDGVDCEQTFDKCTEFKDFENPAMVSAYHDINKLVQARKLNNK